MTDPNPTPDDWQDFYKNPAPPSPVVKPPVPKRKVSIAVIISVVGLLAGWKIVSWSLSPSEPPANTLAQQRPELVIPPEVINRILSPTPTTPTTPTPPARTVVVAAPETLSGRTKSKDPELVKLASDEETRMNGLPKATSVASVFYGSHAKKNLVFVIAAAAKMPSSDLDILVHNSMVGSEIVKQPEAVDPGPLGGRAVCAEGTSKGVKYSVCGWADDGSIGIIIQYYKTMDKAQAEFRAMRAALEKVS